MLLTVDRSSFTPIHQQINAFFRDQIERQAAGYRPGDRLPSEHHIAKTCGVNRLTAHKAIGALAEDGLVTRIAGKGTFVCALAQRPQQQPDVGFVIARDWWLSGQFVTSQMLGVRKWQRRQGRDVRTLLTSVEHEGDVTGFVRDLDGVIVIGDCIEAETFQQITSSGTPAVVTLVDATSHGLASVVFDEALAAYEQTRHLIALGHRDIAFVNSTLPRHQKRVNAFRRAMAEAGLTPRPEYVIEVELSPGHGRQAGTQLFTGKSRPTAVVAASANLVVGMLDVLAERGLTVPDDLSLVAVSDPAHRPGSAIEHLRPPLAMYAQSFEELGAQAMATLGGRMTNSNQPATLTRLSGALMPMASTAAPSWRG